MILCPVCQINYSYILQYHRFAYSCSALHSKSLGLPYTAFQNCDPHLPDRTQKRKWWLLNLLISWCAHKAVEWSRTSLPLYALSVSDDKKRKACTTQACMCINLHTQGLAHSTTHGTLPVRQTHLYNNVPNDWASKLAGAPRKLKQTPCTATFRRPTSMWITCWTCGFVANCSSDLWRETNRFKIAVLL